MSLPGEAPTLEGGRPHLGGGQKKLILVGPNVLTKYKAESPWDGSSGGMLATYSQNGSEKITCIYIDKVNVAKC